MLDVDAKTLQRTRARLRKVPQKTAPIPIPSAERHFLFQFTSADLAAARHQLRPPALALPPLPPLPPLPALPLAPPPRRKFKVRRRRKQLIQHPPAVDRQTKIKKYRTPSLIGLRRHSI